MVLMGLFDFISPKKSPTRYASILIVMFMATDMIHVLHRGSTESCCRRKSVLLNGRSEVQSIKVTFDIPLRYKD